MREPAAPKELLDSHGVRHKKHFGQNFLADRGIARRIAELATTPPGGSVIEIGAGLGALTGPLLERASKVIAIERDRELVPVLREEFSEAISDGRLTLLEADAKKVDYPSSFADLRAPRVLAGNLPYQLTGPLLTLAVDAADALDRVVFMVQLEVCERLTAAASEHEYGALTVFTQAAFSVERAFVVRRGAFYPQPNVDSAVVTLTPRRPRLAAETDTFRALVHAAFGQRRKTLRNAWRGVLGIERDRMSKIADAAGVDLDARGETLDVAAFARVARLIDEVAT
jgi:16S rRNA (adenine1518-N6/adenine1519-N6)-dimethyltransferase